MAKLSCSAENCVNNIGGLCTAGAIQIGGENAHSTKGTQCNTFGERNFKNALESVTNTNYLGELVQAFSSNDIKMSPKIGCEAINCMFNKDKICNASNVHIRGNNAESEYGTKCETFIAK
ncbi:DUF1540 domain-containing protein [Clostridium fallax]|uniref:DUF1540 domain-containing protein n=1 Tax=Clostridium fallax TaxID=1533 RepID=A0A1M4VKK1_9CLOT|nr:DUF1540 domain-containing protein [Clostridium fallax]SHE69529.1 protein of unknown function [Clostridium fallax]SQB22770.1 protein of uncharacterised function (DUF1540) [Clostridium fallax]